VDEVADYAILHKQFDSALKIYEKYNLFEKSVRLFVFYYSLNYIFRVLLVEKGDDESMDKAQAIAEKCNEKVFLITY
jgi:hypothetical protein